MRQRGGENSCRCKVLVATTLLDPEKHPPAEIAAVYLRRWRIKLSFRDIKTSMELEYLRVESPEIAAKEQLAGLVAYNLVRVTMIEAACRHGAPLDRLSFKGTVDGLRHYGLRMARARSQTALRRLRRGLFHAVAKEPDNGVRSVSLTFGSWIRPARRPSRPEIFIRMAAAHAEC